MRAISYWRPALWALGVLGFALNVSAVDQTVQKRKCVNESGDPGGRVLPPGPGNPLLSPAGPCFPLLFGGMLPTAGGWLSGDTLNAGDGFDGDFPPYPSGCGYSYGPSGNDEIWEFTVEDNGLWTFDTCTKPAFYDTTIGISYDIGIGCPGIGLVCNGDDPCGAYWESAIRDVCLHTGQLYWLIVDGWSPASYFPGTYYDVTYIQTVPACTDPASCGSTLCNPMVCANGCCEPGPSLCKPYQDCDPVTSTCFNRYDRCITWAVDETLPGSFSPQCYNGCPGATLADDIQLHVGSGRKLISYQTYTQARNIMGGGPAGQCLTDEPLGTPYSVHTDLWYTLGGGECVPDTIIPGASCDCDPVGVVDVSGTGSDICLCEPNGGMQTDVVLPIGKPDSASGQCGVDFYVGVVPGNSGSGVSLSTNFQEQFLGGPALDDEFGQSVMAFQSCDAGGDPGTPLDPIEWGFGAFAPPTISDSRGVLICTTPIGACCHPDGGCDEIANKDCDGTYQGDHLFKEENIYCDDGDKDDDGFFFGCDNCPNTRNDGQEDCNDDGEGDACDPDPGEGDKDADGCCDGVDACPNDPRKCANAGQCGCGEDEIDTDGDGCMDCVDLCPNDPDKCDPGICGCNAAPGDRDDNDGDGYLNCVDQCPGADDAVFAPGCKGAIPTVSEWGLVILALLLLAAGKVYFGRRKATA